MDVSLPVRTAYYPADMRTWWKWLGLAGVVGVAVSGAAVARRERQRRSYSPEEIRDRLHARLADAGAPD